MIAFKRLESVEEWMNLHPMLREVLIYLLAEAWPKTVDMAVTRIFSPEMPGESGVHRTTPHRAADIRTSVLPDVEVQAIVKRINNAFDYGGEPGKNVALFHQVPGSVMHLHIQVRDETKRRVFGTGV